MGIGKFGDAAKRALDARGGMDSLKEDAREVGGILKGPGSLKEKAKRAADALKEPGAPGGERTD